MWGQGGPVIPELPPDGKWLRLVRFSAENNDIGDDEFEIFAASSGDVYPPNAGQRYIPDGGTYTVNRTLIGLSPISNIRITAVEDDCEHMRLKIGDSWIEKTWRQVKDIITFAPNPEALTDNFLGARLNIQQVGLQLAKQFVEALWNEVRRKHGEISTDAGKDYHTFDFSDREVKTVFEAMAHRGGCLNSDDHYRANTINITILNIQNAVDIANGEASTTGHGRGANFVFTLQNNFW